MTIDLTSRLVHAPLPLEVLADPMVQENVASCERQGGVRCRESTRPADSRTEFSRARDGEVVVLVKLSGVEPAREYALTARWIGPDGGIRGRVSVVYRNPARLPPGHLVEDWSTLHGVPGREPGQWRVEIEVNGRLEGEWPFRLVD